MSQILLGQKFKKQPLCKVTRIIKSCENFTLEFETFTEVHLSTTIIFDHIKSHCLDLDLNGFLTRRNFWCIPGMLGHYTIPKWKEFLKSRKQILRKSYLSTFIHVNKHMDEARDIFWIKSLNGTFLALQIKSFGPKKFWFSCMGKKVPFWQFFRIFKNCQNGTFLPMHENQNFYVDKSG